MEENYTAKEKEKLAGIEENAVAYPAGGYNRKLYEAAGAVFNRQTGFYELNGLTDITEEQMDEIYFHTNDYPVLSLNNAAASVGRMAKFRTTIPKYRNATVWDPLDYPRICWCYAEVIKLFKDSEFHEQEGELSIYSAIIYCPNLRVLGDHLNNKKTSVNFESLPNLITVYIKLYKDAKFSGSPFLSKESILYMITECQAESAITITLHPDAYMMAMADKDVQSALAEKTFVSLASV